jgi:hypothetical protein
VQLRSFGPASCAIVDARMLGLKVPPTLLSIADKGIKWVRQPQSWCDPAGESPAQVRSSIRLVASVALPLATATAKRTQRLHGVWDRATKGQVSQGPSVSIRPKATCAAPLCDVPSPEGHITCKGIASEAGRSRV